MPASFDADALLREYGDTALVLDLARLLVDTLPAQLNAVQSALDTSDGPALKAAAHKLKGSIATFGAARAVELARGLELCGVSGDIASGRASGPELQDEVRALCASAQAWLASQTGDVAPS